MTSTQEKTFGIEQEKFVPFDEIHLDKGGDDLSTKTLPDDLDAIRPEVPQQEKSVDSFEKEDDDTLLTKAEVAIERGHNDIALNFARRISDPKKLNDLIRTAVTILVSNKDYDFARKLVSLSEDPTVFDRENQYIDGAEGNVSNHEEDESNDADALDEFDSPKGRVVDSTPYVSRREAGSPVEQFESAKDEVISDEDFDTFVKTGNIYGDVLALIADRIARGEKTTQREVAIYDTFKDKIELLLRNRLGEEKEKKETEGDKTFGGTGLNIDREPLGEVKTEKDDNLKSAVDIAMEKTNSFAQETTPPPIPNVVEATPEATVVVETAPVVENVDESLKTARDEYFKEYVAWKDDIRKSKNIFGKMMMDFGVDKKLPEKPEPEALVIAKNAYIQSKAKKFRDLINKQMSVPNQDGRPLGLLETEAQAFREELLEAIENENKIFQSKFIESLPQKEKSIITRGLEKWGSMSKTKKLAFSSALIFGGSVIGGAGLYGAAAYTGYRAGKSILRSTVGTAMAQGAGKVMDLKYREDSEIEKEGAKEDFIQGINLANFAEREKKMMEYFEAKNAKDKRQLLKKALVKTGIMGATAIGVGLEADKFSVPSINTVTDHTETVSDKVEVTKEALKRTTDIELKPVPEVLPTEVSLSPKGFIEDFRNLQANILAEYHDKMDTMPQALKDKILSKTPTQLAKDFHFYDPEHNASGVGFKGEALGIDKDGNLYYEHLDGNKQVIFDSKTGEVHPFDGQMNAPESVIAEKIEADKTVSVEEGSKVVEDTPEEAVEAQQDVVANETVDTPKPETEIDAEETPTSNEETVSVGENFAPQENLPVEHITISDNHVIDITKTDTGSVMAYEGVNIGHEEIVDGGKLMALNDEFQDGDKYLGVRKAFVEGFEKTVKADMLGPTPYAEPFEGGKIYISYHLPNDPDHVRILLNGKVIAEGELVKGVPKVELYGNLKSSLFYADTVYERAFKHINRFIKQGLRDGSVDFTNH